MKALYPFRAVLLLLALSFISLSIWAQCPAGWGGPATLKWDNRTYLTANWGFNGYVTNGMSQNQAFALGTNRLSINRSSGIAPQGLGFNDKTVTATTGSYGNGASVSFIGNGTFTFTFDTVVANLQFSLYDIDNSQTANVTAKDASGNPLDINMSILSSTILTLSGPTTSPTATANSGDCTSTGTDYSGVVNVSISGFSPAGTNGVKTVTITIGGTSGDFWLSDISACVYKTFPTNYYLVSKPWTGQPAYILNNSNAPTASTTDVATGNCRYVFTDNAAGNPFLNSLGYDPYGHILYYVLDGMASAGTNSSNKAIKKYDFNTLSGLNATMSSGTISTLIPDVTQPPFYIPVFDQGMESGGAAFYGGSYYIGIEGQNEKMQISGKYNSSSRTTMIWRIDFDATGKAIKASQVWAFQADDGSGHNLHNYSDFSISNGILYDFSSSGNPNTNTHGQYTHCNLQTGMVVAKYYPSANPVPGQSGTIWNEDIYWLHNQQDFVALYNKAGSLGTQVPLTGNASIDWSPSGSGDASDAFKPPLDYGDAPASYDPATADPASHDYDSTLKFGVYWNAEFKKKTTVDATGDGATDDGMPSPPVFSNTQTSYSANVYVYNNTGAAATVAGWIDLNNNGVFDPSEGVVVNLSTSNTSQQLVHLAWTGPTIPIGVNYVFLRIRVTSASNGMTASNPTGYYPDGEVEDYRIPLSGVLQTRLVSFNAIDVDEKYVKVGWQTAGEMNMQSYVIERSGNGAAWEEWKSVSPKNITETANLYTLNDEQPLPGTSYYRLKMVSYSGDASYGTIAKVTFRKAVFSLGLKPNPFKDALHMTISLPKAGSVTIRLIDAYGKVIHTESINGNEGNNEINLSHLPTLVKGVYVVEAATGTDVIREKVLRE